MVNHVVNQIVNHMVDHIVNHVEKTYTGSHTNVLVNSVFGTHRNFTLKLLMSKYEPPTYQQNH